MPSLTSARPTSPTRAPTHITTSRRLVAPRPSSSPVRALVAPVDPMAGAARRLARRFAEARDRASLETMAALRAALTEVVDQLSARGTTVDRIAAAVDAVLCAQGIAPPRPTLAAPLAIPLAAAGLRARLLRWSVQALRDEWW